MRLAPRATAFGISLAITVVLLVAAIGVELGSALWPVAVAACVAAIVTTFIGKGIPGLREFFAALGDHDFRWVFLTRMVMQIGIFSIVPFIDSYFEKVVGSKNSGAASSYWLLAVIAGGIVPAVWGGRLSDRAGRGHTILNDRGHTILGISSGNNLGFRVVFGSAAIWFTLGTVLVSRIRGVR